MELTAAVFACLDELIDSAGLPASHRELLRVHVAVGREQAQALPAHPAIQLPLLAYQALRGTAEPAVPLAAACLLIYLGADLCDNLADHELPPAWLAWDAAQASLAATTMLAALPTLALARLADDHPPERRWRVARHLAQALLLMSAGQHEDLLYTRRAGRSPAECLAMLERKSGAEYALFIGAGALLGGADEDQAAGYAELGRALGTASQLVSDVDDIWGAVASRDLRNGTHTLPVVYALSALEGAPREQLLELLQQAQEAPTVHAELRAMLERAGALRYTALRVEVYRQRAQRLLRSLQPHPAARPALDALLDGLALFRA